MEKTLVGVCVEFREESGGPSSTVCIGPDGGVEFDTESATGRAFIYGAEEIALVSTLANAVKRQVYEGW